MKRVFKNEIVLHYSIREKKVFLDWMDHDFYNMVKLTDCYLSDFVI